MIPDDTFVPSAVKESQRQTAYKIKKRKAKRKFERQNKKLGRKK